jgi:hypothetical protein
VLTADHGAAPLPEISGAVRLSRVQLKKDMEAKFNRIENNIDVVQAINSSQIYINRTELALNGFKIQDVVKFLSAYEAVMMKPYNMLADEWLKKGKPLKAKFFHDVVAKEDL